MTRFIDEVSWQPKNYMNSLTFKIKTIVSHLADL